MQVQILPPLPIIMVFNFFLIILLLSILGVVILIGVIWAFIKLIVMLGRDMEKQDMLPHQGRAVEAKKANLLHAAPARVEAAKPLIPEPVSINKPQVCKGCGRSRWFYDSDADFNACCQEANTNRL